MKTIHRRAVGGLMALTAFAGCGGQAPEPAGSEPPSGSPSPEYVDASIQQSLERLNALRIVEVGRLVLDLPVEAWSCYGPCAGWEEKFRAERARQAPRAERLASLAEKAAADASLAPREMAEADAALRALAGLAIVEVGDLIEVKPANNPQCYNLPCQTDVAAAEANNRAHVGQVFAVVDGAKKAGL